MKKIGIIILAGLSFCCYSLNYSFFNNVGWIKPAQNQQIISNPKFYTINENNRNITVCSLNTSYSLKDNSALFNCSTQIPRDSEGNNLLSTHGTEAAIAVNSKFIFLTNDSFADNNDTVPSQLIICQKPSDGNIGSCKVWQPSLKEKGLQGIAVTENMLYYVDNKAVDNNNLPAAKITSCAINQNDGTLNNCKDNLLPDPSAHAFGINIYQNRLYVVDKNNAVYIANLDASGYPANSGFYTDKDPEFSSPRFISFAKGYAYISNPNANEAVAVCKLDNFGHFTNCSNQYGFENGRNTFYGPVGVATFNNILVISNWGLNSGAIGKNVSVCAIQSDGAIGSCITDEGMVDNIGTINIPDGGAIY